MLYVFLKISKQLKYFRYKSIIQRKSNIESMSREQDGTRDRERIRKGESGVVKHRRGEREYSEEGRDRERERMRV